MKLNDMKNPQSLKKLTQIVESRFGKTIDFSSITLEKAHAMRNSILETVTRIRRSSSIHTAEKNPKYMEMLIMYEGLSQWIDAHNARQLNEDEIGTAAAILAAKDMVDTVQDMLGKVSKMQNEQLPALVDSIRDQLGAEKADAFKLSVTEILETLTNEVSMARDGIDASVRTLTGEEPAVVAPEVATASDDEFAPGAPSIGQERSSAGRELR